MLLEDDDLPLHQAPTSLAHVMGGHPDGYDRFWFNGYRDDLFFGVSLGIYPNRGVVDAALGTVRGSTQRSVFSSGRLDGRATSVGPISIELVEPMRVATVRVDAAAQGLRAAMTFTARSVAIEEPRQTRYDDERVFMDVTRATQLGTWSGWLEIDGERLELDDATTRGTKDRSWGIRPLADRAATAPSRTVPQLYFLWAPLHFDDCCLHFTTWQDDLGVAWSRTAATLPLLSPGDSPVDASGIRHFDTVSSTVRFRKGRRYAEHATLIATDVDGTASTVELEPVLRFHMRGAGYEHPTFPHGRFHGDLVVGGEVHDADELDTTSFSDVHVQHVVRATWGERVGVGVLEQFVVGPHRPSGLVGLLDGAP